MRGLLIGVDGTVTEWNGSGLDDLQEALGGYIENIVLSNGDIAYVNEEGKLRNLPMNERATEFCRKNARFHSADYIVGPMLVFGPLDKDGNETDIRPMMESLIKQ